MQKILDSIIKHRHATVLIFLLITIISVFMNGMVRVNYNIMDYLPDEAASTIAIDAMEAEFDGGIPNCRAMVPNMTIPEALEMKARIAAIDGIESVLWLDDVADVNTPMEMLDADMVADYYVDENALFTITVSDAEAKVAMPKLREVVGEETALSGIRVNTTFASENIVLDIQKIMLIAVPIILVILLLTTDSWFEPVLFLITIGVAILINMGTNIFFGEISFITMGVASILQLAVSMDYAIFILHRFAEFKEEGLDTAEAMRLAVQRSFSSVCASGVTTIAGFAALLLMRIKIGPDVGWVMVKAICLSLLCVFTFLPALTVLCNKLIEKTRHRSLVPSMKRFGRAVLRLRIPALVIMLVCVVPSILAVGHNDFVYFDIFTDARTRVGQDAIRINETFGESSTVVLMVEKGDFVTEQLLVDEISELPNVTSVVSYVNQVGAEIPMEFLPEDTLKQLIGENYSRMIITMDTDMESEGSFHAVETIRGLGDTYYPGAYHLAGEACNTYDMKTIVEEDNARVNIIAVCAVFVILLLKFKSVILPFLLLFVIEGAIWINCGYPYFAGSPMYYIAYLVIGALQLGATVDYAILFTDRYMESRRTLQKREALLETVQTAAVSIITSGSILFIAGFILSIISTNILLSSLGTLIARGTLLSLISVLFVLPALLTFLDKPIQRLTYKSNFCDNTKGMNAK
ncbi:MMPL family transporter [Eubacteriales bacterium OttesenSCG-928-A19]|nr:MMPL family transporter [Eubacteriales bacterium OttesenSCG-928-A19]